MAMPGAPTPQPIPGVRIKAPLTAPQPGQVIIGYNLIRPEAGCCKCGTLSTGGWLAVVVITLIFPCVACIPCCMEDLHESYQVPVYGNPGAVPPGQAGPPNAQQMSGYPPTGYPAPGQPYPAPAGNVEMLPPKEVV